MGKTGDTIKRPGHQFNKILLPGSYHTPASISRQTMNIKTQPALQVNPMKKIRILVVEDQTVVRDGIVAILSCQPDMEIVGEAENGIRAMELARKQRPEVVILD